MTLDAIEFIRRFLQHVLPTGFMKIRHYGFLNANCAVSIEKISELITLIYDVILNLLPKFSLKKTGECKCSKCGHNMHFIGFMNQGLVPSTRSSTRD